MVKCPQTQAFTYILCGAIIIIVTVVSMISWSRDNCSLIVKQLRELSLIVKQLRFLAATLLCFTVDSIWALCTIHENVISNSFLHVSICSRLSYMPVLPVH